MDKPIKIRRAKLSDSSIIYNLGINTKEFRVTKKTFFYEKEELKIYIKNKKNIFLVVEMENNVVGFILGLNLNKYWCIIDTMVILKKYRGLGIGTELLKTLTTIAKKNKITYIQGLVITDNKKGRLFWKKHGFTEGKTLVWIEKFL